MFGAILSVFIVSFILWIYIRWMNVKQYWAKLGVPHLPPHPLLGSLTFLQRKNPALWMIDTYRRFKTPYVGVWLFWRPALVINSPDLARNVLVKDFAIFKNRFLQPSSKDPLKHNLFTANDPLWSSVRRNLTTVFTAAKLKALKHIFETKTRELIQRIDNTEDKSKINIRMVCTDYTTDIIATASFGVQTNATLTGEDPIRTVTKTFMNFDLYKGICWSSIFFFPKLADLCGFPIFSKWSTDYFRTIFLSISKLREERRGNHETKDLLDSLLKLKENKSENKEGFSVEVILAQAVVFLVGGFETSGSVLSFAIYELAHQPDLQEKLYREVMEAKKKCQKDYLDMFDLVDLTYLDCVIKETLRKYPPFGYLDRKSLDNYKVDDNLTIPVGTTVYVNVIGMHYDSNYFSEPETFNPDRFLPENEKDLAQFTFMPFGEGPRNCIGKRFGMITLRSALSALVSNYKFVPLPGTPKPSEVEIDKRGIFMVPGEILNVDFVRRDEVMSA